MSHTYRVLHALFLYWGRGPGLLSVPHRSCFACSLGLEPTSIPIRSHLTTHPPLRTRRNVPRLFPSVYSPVLRSSSAAILFSWPLVFHGVYPRSRRPSRPSRGLSVCLVSSCLVCLRLALAFSRRVLVRSVSDRLCFRASLYVFCHELGYLEIYTAPLCAQSELSSSKLASRFSRAAVVVSMSMAKQCVIA